MFEMRNCLGARRTDAVRVTSPLANRSDSLTGRWSPARKHGAVSIALGWSSHELTNHQGELGGRVLPLAESWVATWDVVCKCRGGLEPTR